jgi:hypothetical protein
MDVRAALIPDQQSAEAVQPSQFSLDDPAVTTKTFARLDSLASDSRYDPASTQPTNIGGRPIPQITVQLRRTSTRAAGPTTYRRDAIDHFQERDDIEHVRGGEHRWRERNAPPINDYMVLRAEFRAVRGVGAGRHAPRFWPARAPNRRQHATSRLLQRAGAVRADGGVRAARRLPAASPASASSMSYRYSQALAAGPPRGYRCAERTQCPSTRRGRASSVGHAASGAAAWEAAARSLPKVHHRPAVEPLSRLGENCAWPAAGSAIALNKFRGSQRV